jgi:protein-S-isoprenylcysteine O-methyltransferase Ste14
MLIISYVWARLRYFTVNARISRVSSYIYDPMVTIQILSTIYHFFTKQHFSIIWYLCATFAYLTSLLVFWWVIRSRDQLDFAFGTDVRKLITSGPFAIVRHPLYISYIITWATGTFLFHSNLLWITLIILVCFYVLAAHREEKTILRSKLKKEYSQYKKEVGMFLPKATQWKRWIFGLSLVEKR